MSQSSPGRLKTRDWKMWDGQKIRNAWFEIAGPLPVTHFHPRILIPHFPFLHFPPLQSGAAFYSPAFSCLAFTAFPSHQHGSANKQNVAKVPTNSNLTIPVPQQLIKWPTRVGGRGSLFWNPTEPSPIFLHPTQHNPWQLLPDPTEPITDTWQLKSYLITGTCRMKQKDIYGTHD